MNLSIVIPIKDEKDNIPRLHERITQALADKETRRQGDRETEDSQSPCLPVSVSPCPRIAKYEIVLVDDGSTDGSHAALEALAQRDARVKVVRLRRNFGQSAALQAGIDHASGD